MLKVYNSLSNKIEEFIPVNSKKVNMYVCGPTVYNSIHIGNARPVVFFDMLKRYLMFLGYNVTYATNITDVDDKIIKKALELKVDEKVVSKKNADNFLVNVKELGCLEFDHTPYATNYIDQMASFIQELINKGFAYEVDGDVYFRVNKAVNYGILSNQKIEELNNGIRIDVNSKKESPIDFTLWKKTDVGVNWKTSFSNGRPGWHTECVCMIQSLFKDTIDIHGGGFDLKFPHHENEIAQYEIINNKQLSKYFMHVGRLDFNGEKMSKSIGNMILVDELREDNLFMQYKLLVLMHNYRSQINFSNDLFDDYKKDYEKILRTLKQANVLIGLNNKNLIDDSYIEEFKKCMNDDFNTPNVYTLILKIVKEINTSTRNKELEQTVKLFNSLNKIFEVLGITFPIKKLNIKDIENLTKWEEARTNKDFTNADKYRDILVEVGVL